MTGRGTWPAADFQMGPALTAYEASARLGQSKGYVDVQLKRTRDGKQVRVRFPEPDGAAIPNYGYRRPNRYWWEQTVIEYGRAARLLDGLDRPKKRPEGDR